MFIEAEDVVRTLIISVRNESKSFKCWIKCDRTGEMAQEEWVLLLPGPLVWFLVSTSYGLKWSVIPTVGDLIHLASMGTAVTSR